jgi:hypothetical protein
LEHVSTGEGTKAADLASQQDRFALILQLVQELIQSHRHFTCKESVLFLYKKASLS